MKQNELTMRLLYSCYNHNVMHVYPVQTALNRFERWRHTTAGATRVHVKTKSKYLGIYVKTVNTRVSSKK